MLVKHGIEIAYEWAGDGPPLMFVHGVAGSHRLWKPQAIPDAKLVVIPGAGHVSNLEQPERFNQAVREFLPVPPPARR